MEKVDNKKLIDAMKMIAAVLIAQAVSAVVAR